MKTITLFGDSILYGIVVNPDNLKYAKCPDYDLRQVGANFDYDLLNISQMGRNTSEAIMVVKEYLTRHPAPEYAIIEFGGNDCNRDWGKIQNGGSGEVKIPIDEFCKNIKTSIDLLHSHGTKVALMNMPPVESLPFLDFVSTSDSGKATIKAFLGDVEQIYINHENYSKAIEALATELNIPCIDIRSAFSKPYSDYLCVDGVHPNQKGYQLIKEKLIEYLKSL